MRIGNLDVDHPVVLAPMAGITDYPFRRIARESGCPLAFTEMVSAEGVLRKSEAYVELREDEHPIVVQLFGADPTTLAEAAERMEGMGADGIDINMGCPASQVVDAGAGVALMRLPEKAQEILNKVRRRVRGFLTIKIRSGWDKGSINAVEIARIAEGCGVDAVTLHPRTKVQGFRDRADWSLIGEVKKAVRISVIGNGDVTTRSLARRMFEETGCDGVMIGRGALGNPWIFSPHPAGISDNDRPALRERRRMIEGHFALLRSTYAARGATREMRRHLAWYTRGLPSSSAFRSTLPSLRDEEALRGATGAYFEGLERRGSCRPAESAGNRSTTG